MPPKKRKVMLQKRRRNIFRRMLKGQFKPMELEIRPRFFSGRGKIDKPYRLTGYALERHSGKQLSFEEAQIMAENSFVKRLGNVSYSEIESFNITEFQPVYFAVGGGRTTAKFEPNYRQLAILKQKAVNKRRNYMEDIHKRDLKRRERNA